MSTSSRKIAEARSISPIVYNSLMSHFRVSEEIEADKGTFMLTLDVPALILAPMDGLTDAPMRAVQGETGAFTRASYRYL